MNEIIYWLFELKVKDGELENLKSLMKEMTDQTKDSEPDALSYEWFISEDGKKCHLYERYKDSAAVLIHLDAFRKNFARRLMALADPEKMTVYGKPDEEAKKALSKGGGVFMIPVEGFSR